jgi:para-nitrobenzyl esterase
MAIVGTSTGRVAGRETSRGLAFLGIPYAEPPVETLRWRAPRPAKPWAGVREATRVGPGAPQRSAFSRRVVGWLGGATATSEDCLTLNVWTPGCDGARRPVMVWIHGGAFAIGTGGAAVYEGARLAQAGDVVVVTLNYRLGALGFLALRAPGFEANGGLRDQLLALAWVRENVERFGGDPARITLFGESAGAMSVATLLGLPSARGLFAGAIAQSGAAHHVSREETAERVAATFLRELGLGAADAPRLREVPVEPLLDAQVRTAAALGVLGGTLPWQPAIDGALLAESPLAAIERGEGARVPLLVGTNRDEWDLFLLGDPKSRRMDDPALRRRFARVLPPGDADEAHALYREVHADKSPRGVWAAFQTDRVFRAPAERLAAAHGARAPVWQYLFTWAPPLARGRLGACHAVELPLVFGTLRHPALALLFSGGHGLSRRIQARWTELAHTGSLAGWEGYTEKRRFVAALGPDDARALGAFEPVRAFWAARGDGPRG